MQTATETTTFICTPINLSVAGNTVLDIDKLMSDSASMDERSLHELRMLVEQYPFYQAARLLYVNNLFVLRRQEFGAELAKASLMVPDRAALFQLFEQRHYAIEVEGAPRRDMPIETEGDGNRTLSLIDSFLATHDAPAAGEAVPAAPHAKPTVAEVTSDYAAFLAMQDSPEEDAADEGGAQLRGAELIDTFIEQTKGKQRYALAELDDDELLVPDDCSHLDEGGLYNENIANIYIKQGRYAEALEILSKISLTNPEKKANFAPQMKLLQVIVGDGATAREA